MKNYPFVKCLNPEFIKNKYTGELVLTSCGKCEACLNRKAYANTTKCKLESLSHKYCMFITLTYNQISVPLMRPQFVRNGDYIASEKSDIVIYDEHKESLNRVGLLFEMCKRLRDYNNANGELNILGEFDLSKESEQILYSKCNTFNLIPHLSKRDAQLFIKRLRKYVSKISSEKIRYYLVGEYGPIHYRPHYHLLLWFSDEAIYRSIHECVHKSWSYGRIDIETSRGQSASYVAKYVSGNSRLPRVFTQGKTKPFTLHSQHLGEMVLKQNKEEVYETPVKDFIRRSIKITNNDSDVTLWRSLATWYYPKCKGFSTRSNEICHYAYRIYAEVRDWTKKTRLCDQAKYILDTIFGVFKRYGSFQLHSSPDINNILYYFVQSADINLHNSENYDVYLRRIYMELRLSKHFLKFVCDGDDSARHTLYMYNKIKTFWLDYDLYNVNNSLECLSLLDNLDDDEYIYSYTTTYKSGGSVAAFDIENLSNSRLYKLYYSDSICVNRNNMKHKKLNDENDILNKRFNL